MSKITIRKPQPPKGMGKADAIITASVGTSPTAEWQVTEGNWYALRCDDDWIVVARCTGDYTGGRPIFSLAEGENGRAIGPREIIILADYGPEAP